MRTVGLLTSMHRERRKCVVKAQLKGTIKYCYGVKYKVMNVLCMIQDLALRYMFLNLERLERRN